MNQAEMIKLANELNQLVPFLYGVAWLSVGMMLLGLIAEFKRKD